MPRPLTATLLAGALIAALASASAASAAKCGVSGSEGFSCSTLKVPLDRQGERAGTLSLKYAVQAKKGRSGVLLMLSGGPGQSSIPAIGQFADTLQPALDRDRLVMIDQRGTGATALNCPALQNSKPDQVLTGKDVAACAQRLGPRAADFSTADSVADLEALRQRLGVKQMTVMGISYGTFVAVQYARTYPDRVKGLILDSALGPAGWDPFQLDQFVPMGDVVANWCRGISCPSGTGSPWQNVATVIEKIRSGSLQGKIYNTGGQLVQRKLTDDEKLLDLIWASDLNPALQALLPGALAAAASGDSAPLLRLFDGPSPPPSKASELSAGLFLSTLCADIQFPFAASDDAATRALKARAALEAIPATSYAPFSAATVYDESPTSNCASWPVLSGVAPATSSPIPDVPALILSGTFDQRTPTAGALELAKQFKRASVVQVPGTGHDTVDSDASGCVAQALSRFSRGRAVGNPCSDKDNRWAAVGKAPASLGVTPPIGSGGSRADRQLTGAVALTLIDVWTHGSAQYFSGVLTPRGGGLRGGRYTLSDRTGLRLQRYSLVPGVRLTGVDGVGYDVTYGAGRHAFAYVSSRGTLSVRIGRRKVSAKPRAFTTPLAKPSGDSLDVSAASAMLQSRR